MAGIWQPLEVETQLTGTWDRLILHEDLVPRALGPVIGKALKQRPIS